MQDSPVRGRVPGESRNSFWDRDSIGFAGQWIVFLLVLAALFSKCPEMFLHAQFNAEDGREWFANAYNLHWSRSLLLPAGGYLNTFSRLIAGIALLVPFRYAPLTMNIAGIIVQVSPVIALLSARCRTWGPLPLRVLMAAIYVALPNAREVHVVLTNAHWHLAVLELLIAFASPPRSWIGRAGDGLLFLVGSLSDPFCIVLLPLILFFWWRRRQTWTLAIAAILGLGSVIQIATIARAGREVSGALGATPRLLIRMVGGNIVLSGMTGLRSVLDTTPQWVLVLLALFGILIVFYALRVATLPFRLYAVFAVAIFAIALRHPLLSGVRPLWQLLLVCYGGRYWYYPMLLFLWAAAACIFQRQSMAFRIAGCCVLVVMLRGVVKDWRYEAPVDRHFGLYVDRFDHARPGEDVLIPLNPTPDPWTMDLKKHAN